MANGSRDDPFASFNFLVKIGSIEAGFSECSGITMETDPIEYRNGNEDITVRKLPGLKKFGNITFKRGFTKDMALWEWRKQVLDGKTVRREGSITLLNEARTASLVWDFYEAWPRKLDGPTFNGKNNEVAIESLEIVCEKIEVRLA
jgi:phage tail-like protein